MARDCPQPRRDSIFRHNGIDFGPAYNFDVSRADICRFYGETWMRPVALSVPSFYKWQFQNPPEHGGLDWNCVAIKDGRLIGVMGIVRRTFMLKGEPIRAAELTTWVVSDEARGTGAGSGILKSLQIEYDFLAANSISTVALPVFVAKGFRYIAHLPRYFLVLDREPLGEVLRLDRLGERLFTERPSVRAPNIEAREVPAEFLSPLAVDCYGSSNSFDRGSLWLSWRYDKHRIFKYRAFLVSASGQDGEIGVVIRQDETAGFKFIHVVDLVGDSAHASLAAIFVEQLAREAGSHFVDVTVTNTSAAAAFRAAGWFSINDDAWAQLSHLFYPPQWRQPATSSTGIWSRARTSDAYDIGRLHITKGDMDLDRPTIEYYEQHGLDTV